MPAIRPIDVGEIRLEGEIGRRVDLTAEGNMLAVDLEGEFLAPFREPRDAAPGYVGLGHFLDAASRLARHGRHEKLAELRMRILRAVRDFQDPDGYIGTFPRGHRLAELWDVHETSHLIYGLASDFMLWREGAVLDVARRLADWLIGAWIAAPEKVPGDPVMATLDSEPAMLAMYEASGDRKYLDFCTGFLKLAEWDRPIVLGRWKRIEGHVYDYLSRCVAQQQLKRWRPDSRLDGPTRRALEFMLRGGGVVISGALGEHECWHDSQEGLGLLGETCATAYFIRLLHVLLQQSGDSLHGDVMERAVYNALFAAQSPDGRRLRYYTPLEGPRAYYPRDTYCCPSNFRRIVSELPQMVFYMAAGGVLVNLYTACSAQLTLPGGGALEIRQETDYPRCGEVLILLEPEAPTGFSLDLRIPRWCRGARIAINGQQVTPAARPGSFLSLERTWRGGDHVELSMPMAPRLVRGFRAQRGRAAVMRGPLLYCLNPEHNPGLAGTDPRLLVVDPATLREEGDCCRVRAWGPGVHYPADDPELDMLLSAFPDPGGTAVYFRVPVPGDDGLVPDELLEAGDE